MKRLALAFAALVLIAAPAAAQKQGAGPTPDEVIYYEAQDARMNAAIEEARRTYPQFIAEFNIASAHRQGDYMLKVGLATPDGGHEHIWVDGLRRDGGVLTGALANEPVMLPGMHLGSRVQIDETQISDWSIVSAEGMYGNYTTRVMLEQMNPAEAAEYRAALTPTPIPAHWTS